MTEREQQPAEFWASQLEELLPEFGTSRAGLSTGEAAARLARYGPNDVVAHARTPLWLRFLGRFSNPVVIILLVASGLSAATGEIVSFFIIVTIILFSVVLDFTQEMRAENTIDALRRSVALLAAVRREGAEAELPADQLVPGDVIRLAAGDLVPADCRLIEAKKLFVNQALLTGEPYPAEKYADDRGLSVEGPGAAANAVFMGTSVISGTALALACRTGRDTALGYLASTPSPSRGQQASRSACGGSGS